MANINVRQSWLMDLETSELLLVLKALGGRLTPEDIKPARELGNVLTKIRAVATRTSLEQASHLLAKVEQAEGES